ncbi:MAG: hypothetical protein ACXWWJ_01235 [Nitrospira sp.]
MREVYEGLRKVVPHRSSVLLPDVFRDRVSVRVPYSTDKQVFMNNAMAQWEACVEKDRERDRTKRRQMQRMADQKRLVEDDMEFLRMCRSAMALKQIAQERKCSLQAVYARKRRLVLRYVHPIRLQRTPVDLQEFVTQTSKKYLIAIKTQMSFTPGRRE